MSNILLNHFYDLRRMHISLPVFCYYYFHFFCLPARFLAFQTRADDSAADFLKDKMKVKLKTKTKH